MMNQLTTLSYIIECERLEKRGISCIIKNSYGFFYIAFIPQLISPISDPPLCSHQKQSPNSSTYKMHFEHLFFLLVLQNRNHMAGPDDFFGYVEFWPLMTELQNLFFSLGHFFSHCFKLLLIVLFIRLFFSFKNIFFLIEELGHQFEL